MTIVWYGQTCFRLESSGAALLIDPFDLSVEGLKTPKLDAGVILFSSPGSQLSRVRPKSLAGQPFIIDGPGEYNVKNFFIVGLDGSAVQPVNIYIIEAEGLRLCHLARLDQEKLNDAQLAQLTDIDILMITVGGDGLAGDTAASVTGQIEPRLVLPMHFALKGLKTKLEKPDIFLKEMGVSQVAGQNKLVIKRKDLPQEETRVVILKPVGT